MPPASKPDTSAELLRKRQTDLAELLDRWVAIIEHAVRGMTRELTRGQGHKNEEISREDVTKIRELSTAMRAAADTKIQLAKAAKLLGETMSTEEVLQAAIKRVMGEEAKRRADILSEMVRQHRNEVLLHNGAHSSLRDPETAISLIRDAVVVRPAGEAGAVVVRPSVEVPDSNS